jgi:hypothetical protein
MASTISAGTTLTTSLVQTADTSGVLQLQTNGGTTAVTIDTNQNATFAGKVASASSLQLATNGTTTAVTIDTNQNVGVGVTPSAWQSTRRALQVGLNAALWGNVAGAGTTFLSNNTYFDGTNFKYLNTSGASYMAQQTDGAFIFNSAPSGTAGNAITFTQAMTLNASGNLLLGTANGNGLNLDFSPSTSQQNGITYVNSSPNSFTDIYGCGTSQGWQGAIRFFTSNNAASSERARIDYNGNLLVGLTSAPYASSRSCFQTTTSGANPVTLFGNNQGLYVQLSASSGSVCYFNTNSGANNAGQISVSGTTASYVTSSDYRLKNSVTPMTGALAKVAALNPVTYKWNVDGSAGEGFIAHELAEVCPYAVVGEKDAVDAEGKPVYQGIDTSFLVATLTAAIQELAAQVTTLQTQVTALKG